MTFLFYLDDILIDEPIGFSDIALRIKRDTVWHGIFFEASTSDLQFYGDGAAYLINKKQTEGFAANVTFKAIVECGDPDEIFEGKLDFRQYKEKCGNSCFVVIPVEQEGCIMTLRNRYDQKVDLSNQMAFDKLTVLPNYDGLNFGMELAAQELKLGARAESGEATTVTVSDEPTWDTGTDNFNGYFSPVYGTITNASLGVLNTTDIFEITEAGANNIPPYPSFPMTIGTSDMVTDNTCELSTVVANFRHKGTVNIQQSGVGTNQLLRLKLWRLPVGLDGTVFSNWVEEYTNDLYFVNVDGPVTFDVSATVPITLTPGDFIYYGVFVDNGNRFNITSFIYTQDVESFFELTANSVCPPTDALVSLIHETASRVTEAITDRCLIVKSDYYGRTDSEPYAAESDGCGSLRILTNGLRLRNAENPLQFISLKEVFDGLNAIDNIGMGVELGGVYEPDVLRIEPAEYFYKDFKIADHPSIPASTTDAKPDLAYSIIKVGYKKWETENENGLDEFNSNKEFRTSLKSIDNTLDITSGFIAGGYPIEHTRQQSFADTGAADNKYDNDNFIICVTRSPYAYGNYIVEQGITGNPANFYSPDTAYNWRIRPFYNLMRWWKSIAQSYVNLTNSASKLFFSSGVGNFLASGELAVYNDCKLESIAKAENDDLTKNDMVSGNMPLWYPDEMTYKYPLSLRDYNIIKAAPLGYIDAQCGSGEFVKGFITNLVYRVAKGEADITLRLKWDIQ